MALRCLMRSKNIYSVVQQTSVVLPSTVNRTYSSATRNSILNKTANPYRVLTQIRFKYEKKSGSNQQQAEDSDNDDEEEEYDEFDKKKIAKITVQSMRADLMLKNGVGIARNKIEAAFYENRIRVNGKKIAKKALSVNVGDEIDLIKNESPTNPNHLVIARIEILSAKPTENGISVTMKRFKSLVVEKYE